MASFTKTYLPNYNEFYEKRWFSSANERTSDTITLLDTQIPFTPNLLIHDRTSGAIIAADICEDLWVPIPPSTLHCLNGANIIVNLSTSNETIGKSEYRRTMIKAHSAKLKKIHCDKLVIGISGGLDSTLASLVADKAFQMNQYDPKGILAVTMPGFGMFPPLAKR